VGRRKQWNITCRASYTEQTVIEWSQPLYQFALPILESLLSEAETLALVEEFFAMPVLVVDAVLS
jgi:hypothetical protein